MFCSKCGKEIIDDAVVCVHCGCAVRAIKMEVDYPQGNGMAIAGFVCSFFSPLFGWIFGGIGLSRANKRNGKGKGFSVAAITLASVQFVINWIVVLSIIL